MMEIVAFGALTAAQRETCAVILLRALAHAPSAWKTIEDARAETAAFGSAERIAFAALEGGTAVGWIGAEKSYSHAWELHPLVVEPVRQRAGIGTALCRHLETAAKADGVLTLYLGTDDDFGGTGIFGMEMFPDALAKLAGLEPIKGHPVAFYKKLGWIVTGVIPDADGKGRHDIMMAKKL